jgi:exonuclease III
MPPHQLLVIAQMFLRETQNQGTRRYMCCRVYGKFEKVLIVTLYLSNNTPIDDCKRFVLSHLGTFAPKFTEVFSITAEGRNTLPIILAGDFNMDLKKKENESFVTYMEETFGLKLMSNPQCSTTRSNCKSCITWCLQETSTT